MSKITFVVGLDGSPAGERALAFAKQQASRMGVCTIAICYVIEWSPFSFQTIEENEQRHMRREEELQLARDRVVDPAVAATTKDGFDVTGTVLHGDAAEILGQLADETGAEQIIVGRIGVRGLKDRMFGSVSGRLATLAKVPVTIIP